jgi:hypothetical protein
LVGEVETDSFLGSGGIMAYSSNEDRSNRYDGLPLFREGELASGEAAVENEGRRSPVDRGIMFTEPRMAQYNVITS